jgi:solute carrier family 25 folate transporter 32
MQQRSQSLELTAEGDLREVHRRYGGLVDTTLRIWKREGVPGFFKGVIPNSIRVAPGAAITFVIYEAVMDWLN